MKFYNTDAQIGVYSLTGFIFMLIAFGKLNTCQSYAVAYYNFNYFIKRGLIVSFIFFIIATLFVQYMANKLQKEKVWKKRRKN